MKIAGTGDAVPNGLDGSLVTVRHDPRVVLSVGEYPQSQTVLAKPAGEQRWICPGQIADGIDAAIHELPGSGTTYIQQLRHGNRPNAFPPVIIIKHRDCVRLFHIRAELGEYLIEAHANGHRDTQLILDRLPDFLRDLLAAAHEPLAPCNVQPALIHAVGFHQIGIPKVDVPQQAGELTILIVMRRNDDQAGTGLTRFPIGLPCLYARLLRLLAHAQHNPMPVFRTAAHGDGLSAQLRIQQHLDGCVEASHRCAGCIGLAYPVLHVVEPQIFLRKFLTFALGKCIMFLMSDLMFRIIQ